VRGSIVRRGPNCWAAVFYLGVHPETGKQRYRWVHFPTRAEAEAHLTRLASYPFAAGLGMYGSARVRLGAFLDTWLQDYAEVKVRPRTLATYRSFVRKHLSTHLGHVPIAKIAPATIQQFLAQRLRDGLSPTTVRHLAMFIHVVFQTAVKWGVVMKNPCQHVDPPARRVPMLRMWTDEQCRVFLKVAL